MFIELYLYREAIAEFGDDVARRLKLSQDGTKVLWPQPTDDPEDPQNVRLHCLTVWIFGALVHCHIMQWSDRHKNFQLFVITLAAIVPDFDSGIGMFIS